MNTKRLDANIFKQIMTKGADRLAAHADTINALNVFPVPDGDTGTNMDLTMKSGIKEMEQATSGKVGEAAAALSKGMLMGARGNSGVILSQLFRGFSRAVAGKTAIDVADFAKALTAGVDTAYKAVIKPVEGTLLTVAKDAAKHAGQAAEKDIDFARLAEEVTAAARASLKRTPELLPVLKEVGVVDSGGQGLVTIYEGFSAVLSGTDVSQPTSGEAKMEEMINAVHHKIAQTRATAEDIKYGYCTELMVDVKNSSAFDETSFREALEPYGDSLLVVSDADVLKVHIHTEKPGDVLTYGQRYGELLHIKIENMRRQHRDIAQEGETPRRQKRQPYGLVTVAAGDGLKALFRSLGVHVVIEGGQTMNPSTEDFVSAVSEANAEQVFILPNNGNVMMSAQQAAEVARQKVSVIETKTIPEGIAAVIGFNAEADAETNESSMAEAAEQVKSGQVTFAVRDTNKDGFAIKKGDHIAIADGEIVAVDSGEADAARHLLEYLVTEDDAIVTLLYGEGTTKADAERLASYVNERFPDIEVDIHDGGQPVYAYIVAVEP